jgi:2-aminoadipate transaminase
LLLAGVLNETLKASIRFSQLSMPTIETIQGQIDPKVIDLGVGHPKTAHLPLDRLYRAVQTRFANRDPYFLQYGAEQGDGYLRLGLADFLTQGYGLEAVPEQLFITSGASTGIDLACTLFTRPGDIVLVEEPTYLFALKIFADHQLKPVPIPVDEDGLVIDALEEALVRYQPALLYTVPTFQNPSGSTLSALRRERLVALSQEHNFVILADEVYHFLDYVNPPPKPLAGNIGQGNVLSLGSFSKILAPGLRLGWIQTDSRRIQALVKSGLLDSGGGMNPFTSAMVRGLFDNGDLQANIQELRTVYRQRLVVMDTALRHYLPGATYWRPKGGYFFWVRLPGETDAKEVLEKALAFQVSYKPGVLFSTQGGLRTYVRLCFAYYEDDELEEGIRRLGRALNRQSGR